MIIIQTERALNRFDLETALNLVKPLITPNTKAMADWVARAETSLKATATLDQLESQVTAFYLAQTPVDPQAPADPQTKEDISQPEQTEPKATQEETPS